MVARNRDNGREGMCLPRAWEAGFPGKAEVGGQVERALLTDALGPSEVTAGRRPGEGSTVQPPTAHPSPSRGGRRHPTHVGLPEGDALLRQGVMTPPPRQLLLLVSPSLGLTDFIGSLPRLTRMFYYSYFTQIT